MMLNQKTLPKFDYPVKITPKQCIMCVPICSKYITVHNRLPPKFVKNCRVFFREKYLKIIFHFFFFREFLVARIVILTNFLG